MSTKVMNIKDDIEISNKNIEIQPMSRDEALKKTDKYAYFIIQELRKQGLSKDKISDLISFMFYELAPAFERFLLIYLKKEKWLDLMGKDINPWDKKVFPNGTADFAKYLKIFIDEWKKWNVEVYANTDKHNNLKPDLDEFLQMYPYIKPYFLKFMELSIATINVFNRVNRVDFRMKLDDLKKKVENKN